jgi:GNAT superfamily N-acetyltransferase
MAARTAAATTAQGKAAPTKTTPAKTTTAANVRVREARLADAEDLARLSAQLGYEVPPRIIIARLKKLARDPKAAIFVAEVEGRAAGWMQLLDQLVLETGSRTEVAALVVDENLRRGGVGRKLMEHAEMWARKRGSKWVNLRSNHKRAIAHAFYESIGYRHYKSQKAFRKEIS